MDPHLGSIFPTPLEQPQPPEPAGRWSYVANFTVSSIEESWVWKWISLFLTFSIPQLGCRRKSERGAWERSDTRSARTGTVHTPNRGWGTGSISRPFLLPAWAFPLGSSPLRKEYLWLLLFPPAHQHQTSGGCAVRGLLPCAAGLRHSQVYFGLAVSLRIVSRVSGRVYSRCDSRRVFKFCWGNKGGGGFPLMAS